MIGGDVLQALAMTLAIRARMINAEPDSGLHLIDELLEKAFKAVEEVQSYKAVRA